MPITILSQRLDLGCRPNTFDTAVVLGSLQVAR